MEPRAYKSGATGEPPPLPASPSSGHPASASGDTPATVPGARWWHMTGEEWRNVIVGGGIAPDPYDNTQMLRAIRNIVAAERG